MIYVQLRRGKQLKETTYPLPFRNSEHVWPKGIPLDSIHPYV
jgi:hypothetical protein